MKTTYYTLLYIILLFLLPQNSTAQCHIDDWTALKVFYEALDGDNWRNNTGWEQIKENKPPADCNLALLKGIELDEYTKRIVELSLSNQNLNGNLPNEICNFKELKKISFYNNINLSGKLPDCIGELSKLERITVALNNLSGTIPSEIGRLKNLNYLFIGGTKIGGNIPPELGCLSNIMRTFELISNRLTGSIPPELANIKAGKFSLFNNQLTGPIPPEFGDAIYSSGFGLVLASNNLSGCYHANLKKLCDQLFSPIYEPHIPLSNGNNFDATWDDFCATGAGTCPPVSNCHIDDWLALKALYENTNGPNWKNNSSWPTIFSNNKPPADCDLTSLYGISCNYNGRVDTIDLFNNQLQGNLPELISQLTALEYLMLNNNQLTGNLPATIGDLKKIKVISAAKNQFNGSLPSSLFNLQWLNQLVLSCNDFTGQLPGEFGNLTKLKTLHLSENTFSGAIPSNFGKLLNLEQLDLSNNLFTANIPQSFGNLVNLKSLYLQYNSLTGNIPSSFVQLEKITHFNISHNKMSGCFPTGLGGFCNTIQRSGINSASKIDAGNNFDSSWELYCSYGFCY